MVKTYYLKKYGKRFAGMVGASLMKKAASRTSNYVASKFTRKRKPSGKGRKPAKKPCRLPRKTVKCVKDIVKKEMSKEHATGSYYKNYAGTLLLPSTSANLQICSDHLFWSQGSVVKQRLRFFCPDQFVDAASILFNGKTAALPDTATTNNIADPELKFNVAYASAHATFRNCLPIPIELIVYEVRSKDLESDWFGDDYTDALESTNLNQVGGSTVNRSSLNVSPTMLDALKTRYKIKTTKKVLLPGQPMYYRTMYKPNTLWKKQNFVDGNVLQNVGKDSVQIFYVYQPVTGPIDDPNSVSAKLKVGKLYKGIPSGNASSLLGCITCEVKEIFKIDCPDGMAVANQKDATCIFNAYEAVEQTSTAYSGAYYANRTSGGNNFVQDT